MDFTDNPSYQRLKARMGRITPDKAAVLNALSIDPQFADEMTRKELQGMTLDLSKDYREKSLNQRSQQFGEELGLRREAFNSGKGQDTASTLIGLGNVAASSYYGNKRDEVDMEIIKKQLGLLKRLGV